MAAQSLSEAGGVKLQNAVERPVTEIITTALFSVFMQMNKDVSIYFLMTVVYFLVDALQILSFPLSAHPSMPWAGMPLAQRIFSVLQPLTFYPSPPGSPHEVYAAEVMFTLAAVWSGLNLLLLCFAVYNWAQVDDMINNIQVYRPNWPIRLLRTGGRLTSMPLFIPVLMSLLSPLRCETGSWAGTTCWSGAIHPVSAAFALLLAPCTLVYAVLVSSMYLDRRPDHKRNPMSQSHGRVSVAMVVIKTLLCVVFTFALGTSGAQWFLQCLALAAGLAWLLAFARYLPFHQQWLNEFKCALAGVIIAAGIAGLLALGLGDPDHSIGAWTWLFSGPPLSFFGWACCYLSAKAYSRRNELSSPFAIELKARHLLASISGSGYGGAGSSGYHTGGGEDEGAAMGTGRGRAGSVDLGRVGARHGGGDGGAASSSARLFISDRHAVMRDVQLLFEDGLAVFSGSSLLELFYSSYLGHIKRNRHLEASHLKAAFGKADTSAIDVRFFVWERNRRIDDEDANSNTVKTSVMRRLQFDTLNAESEILAMRARQLTLDFWTEACEKRPDMDRLQTIGQGIIVGLRQTDTMFSAMREMAPNSAAVMRRYADFLLELANDPKQALDLLQAAEVIEEEESKAHAADAAGNAGQGSGLVGEEGKDYPFMGRAPDFDMSNENIALLRVSGEPGRVGLVVDANADAVKLFGYGKREVLGKPLDTLVPEPMGTVHNMFIERYIETGEECIVNTSRNYLGLHRGGYLVPMTCNVRPLDGGFGAVMESIITNQCFVIFTGEWGKWKVTGACKSTMSLLRFTPADIKSGHVTMDRLLPGLVFTKGRGSNNHNNSNDGNGHRGGVGGAKGARGSVSSHGHQRFTQADDPEADAGDDDHSPHHVGKQASVDDVTVQVSASMYLGGGSTSGAYLRGAHKGNGSSHIDTTSAMTQADYDRQHGWATVDRDGLPVHGAGSRASLAMKRTPLMMDLMASSDVTGPGVDVAFTICNWSADAAAASRARRRASLGAVPSAQHPHSSHGGAPAMTMMEAAQQAAAEYEHGQRQSGSSHADVVGSYLSPTAGGAAAAFGSKQHATAKLQEMSIKYLPGPVYVMRWRVSRTRPLDADDEAQASGLRGVGLTVRAGRGRNASGGDSGDDDGASVDSNRVQGSLGSHHDEADDDDDNDRKPLISTPAPAAPPSSLPKSAMKSKQRVGMSATVAAAKAAEAGAASPVPSAVGSSASGAPHNRRASFSQNLVRHMSDSSEQPKQQQQQGVDTDRTADPMSSRGTGSSGGEGDQQPAAAVLPGQTLPSSSSVSSPPFTKASSNRSQDAAMGGNVDLLSGGGDAVISVTDAADGVPPRPDAATRRDGPAAASSDVPSKQAAEERHARIRTEDDKSHKEVAMIRSQGGRRASTAISAVLSDADESHHLGSQASGHPSGDGKKAASVNSGSSAGSSTLTDAIRKGISAKATAMEGSLVNLRRALIGIFLFVAAVNIATLAIANVLYTQLEAKLQAVADNGERGINLEGAYSELQRLRMMAGGELTTLDNATATKNRLTIRLQRLADLHQQLYNGIDESNEEERDLYTQPVVTVADLVPGTYVDRGNFTTTPRNINMMNAGLEFLAKARQVLPRYYRDLYVNESTGTMLWLLSNGPVPIRNAFNLSMIIANQKTTGTAGTILLVNDIVLGLALGLLFMVTALVMAPAIRAVLKQKAFVFQVFLDTPLPILRSMRMKTEKRITDMRRANEEAEAGLDVGGMGEADADNTEAVDGQARNDNREVMDVDGTRGRELTEQSAGLAAAAMAAVSAKGNKGASTPRSSGRHGKHKYGGTRRFKRAASMGVPLMARFGWPLVFIAIYYCITWWWRKSVADTSEYSTSEVFYSHQVSFFIGQSNFNFRNILTYCEPEYVADQFARFGRLKAMLEREQDALLFGDEDLRVRPLLKVSPRHFNLFMDDGCVPHADRIMYYDYNDGSCQSSFYDGLVGKGLQGAYKQYIQLVSRVMDQRLRAVYSTHEYTGIRCVPWSFDSGDALLVEKLAEKYLAAGFDYSGGVVLEEAFSDLDVFMSLNIGLTFATITALILFYWMWYQPMIRKMDTEIKNVRMLLLLFPDEVSRLVPAIQAAGRELMRDGHVSGASSVASGASGHGPTTVGHGGKRSSGVASSK